MFCVRVRLVEDAVKILTEQGVKTVKKLCKTKEADLQQAFASQAAGKVTLIREGLEWLRRLHRAAEDTDAVTIVGVGGQDVASGVLLPFSCILCCRVAFLVVPGIEAVLARVLGKAKSDELVHVDIRQKLVAAGLEPLFATDTWPPTLAVRRNVFSLSTDW